MPNRVNEKLGAWLLPVNHTKAILARELNMSRPTLYSRIRGETAWTWSEILKIAELCECTPNDLTD